MSAGQHHPDLLERFWRLKSANGSIVTCAVFVSSLLEFEVRAWLENGDILWTCCLPDFDAARALAEEWRQWMTANGVFFEIDDKR